MLCTAPLLMTSLQFAAQNLMARIVMRCGLIRKAQDKEALSWRQYAKEGMAARPLLSVLTHKHSMNHCALETSHWGQAACFQVHAVFGSCWLMHLCLGSCSP